MLGQPNGNVSQIVDATRSETLTFTYDELDRLDTVSGPYSHNYDYDPLGNITAKNTTTYTYGSAAHKHAVSALSTGESYSYDPNGNMTQRVEGGSTYSQTFDTENRLVSVQVGSQTTQFLYDPDGNLVKKIKPGGSRTLYVGGIYEVDKSSGGSVTRTVTYYPVAGVMRINSTVYYTLKDHLGSASVTTDSTRTIVGEDRFYPFGETRFTTGNMQTDKLFTGQREMAGLGIYHYGARFYSPKLGRFLSADSIVPGFDNPQNLNRFAYVRNNPLRYTDSTGHWIDQGCGCTGNTRIAAPQPIKKGGPLVGNTDVPFTVSSRPSTPATASGGGSGSGGSAAGGGAGGSNGGRRPSGRGGGSGSTTQSSTAVQGDNQPNIYVPVSGGGGADINVGMSGGNLIDIYVPDATDLGLDTFDPVDELNNILFSDSKDKDDFWSTNRNPRTGKQKAGIEKIKKDPANGKQIIPDLGDARWPSEEGWVKMERKIDGQKYHWNYNTFTGEAEDIKPVP